MVLKGQYLERPTLIPLPSGEVLEAVAHRGSVAPAVLIVPPCPSDGSGMDHVAAAEIAFAASHAGHQTLRFNFRGVGGSQGAISTSDEQLTEELLAAFELARDNAEGGPVLIASIGSSDRLVRTFIDRAPVVGWALVQPSLRPFSTALPRVVVAPEQDASFDRSGWSTLLADGELLVLRATDRSYQRNLPLVGKAVVALASRLRVSDDAAT